MITYEIYARQGFHDAAIHKIKLELRKDYVWEGHKTSTETAIKRACEMLGFTFIRKAKDDRGGDKYVIAVE